MFSLSTCMTELLPTYYKNKNKKTGTESWSNLVLFFYFKMIKRNNLSSAERVKLCFKRRIIITGYNFAETYSSGEQTRPSLSIVTKAVCYSIST